MSVPLAICFSRPPPARSARQRSQFYAFQASRKKVFDLSLLYVGRCPAACSTRVALWSMSRRYNTATRAAGPLQCGGRQQHCCNTSAHAHTELASQLSPSGNHLQQDLLRCDNGHEHFKLDATDVLLNHPRVLADAVHGLMVMVRARCHKQLSEICHLQEQLGTGHGQQWQLTQHGCDRWPQLLPGVALLLGPGRQPCSSWRQQ